MSLTVRTIRRLQTEPLDVTALLTATERPDCGAAGVFVGTVRNHHQGRGVDRLVYTAHERIADRLIIEIETEIAETFGVAVCRVVHRLGPLDVGEAAIIGVARSAHRREAYAAVEALIDAVKHRVPIWKEEFYTDGTSAFVEGCALEGPRAVSDSAMNGVGTRP